MRVHKRLTFTALAVAVTLSLTACNNSDDTGQGRPSAVSRASASGEGSGSDGSKQGGAKDSAARSSGGRAASTRSMDRLEPGGALTAHNFRLQMDARRVPSGSLRPRGSRGDPGTGRDPQFRGRPLGRRRDCGTRRTFQGRHHRGLRLPGQCRQTVPTQRRIRRTHRILQRPRRGRTHRQVLHPGPQLRAVP